MLQLFKSPLVVGLLLILMGPGAFAQSTDANTLFRYGVQAFQQGQLEEARLYLEHARRQGLDSHSLTYNLGVVYYRLAQYEEAKAAFRELLNTDSRALASYNLGLIALKQQDDDTARAAFQAVMAAEAAENLTSLAERQLNRLGASAAEDKVWFGYAAINAGYETNIGLFPDSARSEVDAAFAETVVAGNGYIWGGSDRGVRGDLGYYGRHYISERDFNSDMGQAGLNWIQQAGPGQLRLGGGGRWLMRGGSLQEKHAHILVEYRQGACLGLFDVERCRLRFTAAEIVAEPEYDAYDGQQYRLEARYQSIWQRWKAELDYRGELNDRQDLATGTEFYSVSPQRHELAMKLSYPVMASLNVGVSTGVRYSEYRDPHRLTVPQGTLVIQRSDTRLQAGLEAVLAIGGGASLLAGYDYKNNDSNIARYDYSNQSVDLGIEVSF